MRTLLDGPVIDDRTLSNLRCLIALHLHLVSTLKDNADEGRQAHAVLRRLMDMEQKMWLERDVVSPRERLAPPRRKSSGTRMRANALGERTEMLSADALP